MGAEDSPPSPQELSSSLYFCRVSNARTDMQKLNTKVLASSYRLILQPFLSFVRLNKLLHLDSYRRTFGVSQLVKGRSDFTEWLPGVFVSGRAGLAQPSLTREINGRLTQHPPSAALQLHNYRGILLELVLGRVERRCGGGR